MNSKLEINNKYGPVNVVSFTMKNIEGENVTLKENSSIAQYGETTIEIQDNPFMVNQNARELAISELYGSLVGFQYIPTVFNYKARLYNDCGDKIQVYDVDSEDYVNSLILNQTIEIPATRKSKMENKALSKTQVKNQYISKTEQEGFHTEIMVDKQNQQISSVVSQVTEQNSKISQINQRVDEISSQISDISDITTYGESSYAEVELEDVNTSEPIMLKVHPTVNNISYTYPFNFLYPGNTTFMSDRKIRFENIEKYMITEDLNFTGYKQYFSYNTTTEEYELLVSGTNYNVGDAITGTVYEHKYVDYVLPDDLLWLNNDVYDEFYLDYESQTCQVIKRCGYNADGTVSQLQNEITTNYDYPLIELDEGDYKISILGYQYGYIYVRLMAKNIYTDQFYTKSETNSLIDQTVDNITLSVNQTLTNYSTTSQMNSAINLKAGEITSTVASTYETKSNAQTKYSQLQQTDSQISSTVATKVGNNEVISKINQSSEAVTINANKIGLTANNVLNILSGNTINLTSRNLTIASDKFNVTKAGKLTCTEAEVNGKITSTNGTIGGFTIGSSKLYNGKSTLNSGNSGVYVGTDGISLGSGSTFKVTSNGELTASNANITNGKVWVTGGTQEAPNMKVYNNNVESSITPGDIFLKGDDIGFKANSDVGSKAYWYADDIGGGFTLGGPGSSSCYVFGRAMSNEAYVEVSNGYMVADEYRYFSLEELKKNIEKYNINAIDIIKDSDIYTFNYKYENEKTKKHIGFVIGDKYKTPNEVISQKGDSINSYSMNSIMWKAIQEQQQQIEELKKEINNLKGGK